MLLKEPNLYNVFDVRKLDFCPSHFDSTTITQRYNLQDSIVRWIETKCKGRFYIGKSVSLSDNKINVVVKVGFEDPKELSFFMLACPHLKYT